MAVPVVCDDVTAPLTEGHYHSINQQWSSQCSSSWSYWTRGCRVSGQNLKLKIIHFTMHFRASLSVSQPRPPPEDLFVEQPSDDFFCPVMMGLLLQPHLTSCCGKHLSQEVATRIQREGGACPLCKEQSWSTVLNKHFQRHVKSLRVFCQHKDRGCGWQGELAAFHHHVESCSMSDVLLLNVSTFGINSRCTCGARVLLVLVCL